VVTSTNRTVTIPSGRRRQQDRPRHDVDRGPSGAVAGLTPASENDFVSAILDAVGAIVIVVDADGRLARYNAATSLISGYSAAEIDAHGSLDFLVPLEQRQELLTMIDGLVPGGAVNRRDNEWVRKDGTRRHIAWANTAVVVGTACFAAIATGIDITDRKKLEDELAHQTLHDAGRTADRRLLMDRLEHALASRRASPDRRHVRRHR
jgi:PAS domain S-box-containing protein